MNYHPHIEYVTVRYKRHTYHPLLLLKPVVIILLPPPPPKDDDHDDEHRMYSMRPIDTRQGIGQDLESSLDWP